MKNIFFALLALASMVSAVTIRADENCAGKKSGDKYHSSDLFGEFDGHCKENSRGELTVCQRIV